MKDLYILRYTTDKIPKNFRKVVDEIRRQGEYGVIALDRHWDFLCKVPGDADYETIVQVINHEVNQRKWTPITKALPEPYGGE